MIILKCVGNARRDLPDEESRAAYDRDVHLGEVDLVIGRRYVVYGIAFQNGHGLPRYLICQGEDEYPTPKLGSFFALEEGAVPEGWEIALKTNAGDFAILPSRWARDPRFLEKLVDGEPEAMAYFRGLRKSYEDLLAES
ncbi:MAG: hypothetical protein RL885_07840 [Planctomycetota bacterium]